MERRAAGCDGEGIETPSLYAVGSGFLIAPGWGAAWATGCTSVNSVFSVLKIRIVSYWLQVIGFIVYEDFVASVIF
jgi:hypothetical protein